MLPNNPRRCFGAFSTTIRTGAAPLAAEADALQEAQHDQQHRRRDADLLIGRQQTDQESAEPHDDDRHGEHRLAADLVAEMAEDRGTQRPGQEADGIGAEGGNGRQRRITGGEKHLVEHQRGRGTVDQEVVPLDGGTDHARPHDTPQTCGVVRDARRWRILLQRSSVAP
jgi:hypothetical protein